MEYFEKNKISIKTISAGLYHTVAIDTNDLVYTWGRGLYGVLGNGSNQYSLIPELNIDLKVLKEEEPKAKVI